MTTPIYWFRRFFDADVVYRIIEQTNGYVHSLMDRPRPAGLHVGYSWPPGWVLTWEPLTEEKLWWFLALNLWMTQHKTSNETELWSSHWFWRRDGAGHIMPLRLFQILKAALQFQADDENRDRGDGERPYMSKRSAF